MSDASVITDVSETLRAILDAHLNPSPAQPLSGGGGPLGDEDRIPITIDSPLRPASVDTRVNLYLYHIVQDDNRRNTGQIRLPPPAPLTPGDAVSLIPEPLPLKLYYMVSAFSPDGGAEHRLIGEAIQAFYSHRILGPDVLKGSLGKPGSLRPEVIQLVMLNQDLESLHRIWGNFQEPLRPSVTFEVEGVYLDALAKPRVVRKAPADVDVIAVPFLASAYPAAAPAGATVRLFGANLDVRSPVDKDVCLVRIQFNGAAVAPLAERRTNRALSIVVPASARPGPATLQLQIGEYTSAALPFEVLPP